MVAGTQLSILMVFYLSGWYAHGLDYNDLKSLGVSCPWRDKCRGYKNGPSTEDRNCKCDSSCAFYNDCCIDAPVKRNHNQLPSDLRCLRYGKDKYSGVYAISTCNKSWKGDYMIRRKCVGPPDLKDPLFSAPVIDTTSGKTYRNLHCAECNNANMSLLIFFQFEISSEDHLRLKEEQIKAGLTYNKQKGSWGIYRRNPTANTKDFVKCDITFKVPDYIRDVVRFCPPNIISKCKPNWNGQSGETVRKACEEYMAVVYDSRYGYRNPHCAICNGVNLQNITCANSEAEERKLLSFSHLIDVNRPAEKKPVPQLQCSPNQIYDPYFKVCKSLRCLPGYVRVGQKCVRSGAEKRDVEYGITSFTWLIPTYIPDKPPPPPPLPPCPTNQIRDPYFRKCRVCKFPGCAFHNRQRT